MVITFTGVNGMNRLGHKRVPQIGQAGMQGSRLVMFIGIIFLWTVVSACKYSVAAGCGRQVICGINWYSVPLCECR